MLLSGLIGGGRVDRLGSVKVQLGCGPTFSTLHTSQDLQKLLTGEYSTPFISTFPQLTTLVATLVHGSLINVCAEYSLTDEQTLLDVYHRHHLRFRECFCCCFCLLSR